MESFMRVRLCIFGISYFSTIQITEKKDRNRQKEIAQNMQLFVLWKLKLEDI